MWSTSCNTEFNYKNEFIDLNFEISTITIKYVNNLSSDYKVNYVQYGCEIDLISKVDTIIKLYHKIYLNKLFANEHNTMHEIIMKTNKNLKNYRICKYKNFHLIVATDKNNNLKFGRIDGLLYYRDIESLLKHLKTGICRFENFLPIVSNKDEIIYITFEYNSVDDLLKDYPEYFV